MSRDRLQSFIQIKKSEVIRLGNRKIESLARSRLDIADERSAVRVAEENISIARANKNIICRIFVLLTKFAWYPKNTEFLKPNHYSSDEMLEVSHYYGTQENCVLALIDLANANPGCEEMNITAEDYRIL